MKHLPVNQQGAALLVALMFLVILTLLSVHAMRSSTMELRMAGNEQERRLGFDSAQSARDAVIAANKIAASNVGDVICFGFDPDNAPGCTGANETDVTLPAGVGYGADNLVRTTLRAIAACPRKSGNSATGDSSFNTGAPGGCAYFTVESTYDATDRRGGRVATQEGYIKLLNN